MRTVRRVVVTALAVLGILAIPAAGAQAFEWQVETGVGTSVFDPLSTFPNGEAPVFAEGTAPFTLESEVAKREITIECKNQEAEGRILAGGLDEALVEFSECNITVVGLSNCEVEEPIIAETDTELVSYTIGGTERYFDLFEPSEGEVFTNIEIIGAKCAIATGGEPLPVKGSVVGETEEPEVYLVVQPLTFSRAISEEVAAVTVPPVGLTLGNNDAFLNGTSNQVLTGGFEGRRWGAK